MVVPVLISNCHVSEKPKSGPLTAQARITAMLAAKVSGRPEARATLDEKFAKLFGDLMIATP
ncbi:hypothetical protein GCM10007890_50620 [Methylobacterium tardum]|uniref:Uncharacterized protein n=1 Tax=Methylobacterium tardum TaxID=374432 RepID=A0AA37WV62_9HYPH|nr:hypothetical protein GCM10007890_50620 [Methylobacterium tardum]